MSFWAIFKGYSKQPGTCTCWKTRPNLLIFSLGVWNLIVKFLLQVKYIFYSLFNIYLSKQNGLHRFSFILKKKIYMQFSFKKTAMHYQLWDCQLLLLYIIRFTTEDFWGRLIEKDIVWCGILIVSYFHIFSLLMWSSSFYLLIASKYWVNKEISFTTTHSLELRTKDLGNLFPCRQN